MYDERRAAAWLAVDVNRSSVVADKLVDNAEPQPCALARIFGRKEGVEDLHEVLQWNPALAG
jgi:hypothetical protein